MPCRRQDCHRTLHVSEAWEGQKAGAQGTPAEQRPGGQLQLWGLHAGQREGSQGHFPLLLLSICLFIQTNLLFVYCNKLRGIKEKYFPK